MAGGYSKYTFGYSDPEDRMPSYLGGQEMSQNLASSGGGESAAPAIATGATTGAMMGGPAGAAIGAGGAFLTSYLAQRAADERARRDRAAQIENQYAQNQNQGFNTMMDAFRGALK